MENNQHNNLTETIPSSQDSQLDRKDNANYINLSWSHIVNAVKHEMFPKMGTAMDAAIESLKEEDEINEEDLGADAVEKVIEGMKVERKMTSFQITYIEGLVRRAKEFNEQS